MKGKKINELHIALKQLESWLPKIIAHQWNPFMPTTSNLLESYHKKYTYYPSFKRNMMTLQGAQRVLDYCLFRHNFNKFPEYKELLQTKFEEFKVILSELPDKRVMGAQHRFFQNEFRKFHKRYRNSQRLLNEYFAL